MSAGRWIRHGDAIGCAGLDGGSEQVLARIALRPGRGEPTARPSAEANTARSAKIRVVVLAWQQFIVGSLFGWKGPDGLRRFPTAYIEVGKGNGKSPTAGGI